MSEKSKAHALHRRAQFEEKRGELLEEALGIRPEMRLCREWICHWAWGDYVNEPYESIHEAARMTARHGIAALRKLGLWYEEETQNEKS